MMVTNEELIAALREARIALAELHSLVWGECPRLLDEDAGGEVLLDIACEESLEKSRALLARADEPQADTLERGISKFDVLVIAVAYEQGCGHANRAEIINPYSVGSPEHYAWQLGRDKFKGRPDIAPEPQHSLYTQGDPDAPESIKEEEWMRRPDLRALVGRIEALLADRQQERKDAHICAFESAIDLKTLGSWRECAKCGKKQLRGMPYSRQQGEKS